MFIEYMILEMLPIIQPCVGHLIYLDIVFYYQWFLEFISQC
jgi:hypothetical protein